MRLICRVEDPHSVGFGEGTIGIDNLATGIVRVDRIVACTSLDVPSTRAIHSNHVVAGTGGNGQVLLDGLVDIPSVSSTSCFSIADLRHDRVVACARIDRQFKVFARCTTRCSEVSLADVQVQGVVASTSGVHKVGIVRGCVCNVVSTVHVLGNHFVRQVRIERNVVGLH